MRPRLVVAVAALAAAATVPAAAESKPAAAPEKSAGDAFWERREVVLTGQAGVLGGIGYDAGVAAAKDAPAITGAGLSKLVFGNHEVRGELARELRIWAGKAKELEKALKLPAASTAISVVDTASSVAGRVWEGDYRGGAAELAKEGGKQVTTAAGAVAGAELLGMAGAPLGPLGAAAGAIVGAAGGAMLTAAGYDAYLSDWARAIEGNGPTPDEALEMARESLRTLPERQARERAEAQWRAEWAGVEQASGYSDAAGDAEVELVPERVMSSRVEPDAPPATASDASVKLPSPASDAARPVLFDDCTIEVTVTNPDYPAAKADLSFDVRGDTVTGHAEGSNPGSTQDNGYVSATRWSATFTGTLKDNVLRGQARYINHKARSEHSWEATVEGGGHVRRTCVYEWSGEATSDETWTFELSGRGILRSKGHGVTHGRGSADCPDMTRDTPYDWADNGNGKPLPFVWRVRKK